MSESCNPVKASVIILTYNQEKTVGRAIESVLRQECKYPFEILVADDDSPDATRRVAQEYAERYPDIVRLMPELPNRGLVGNYFDAFEECRGEYIGDCAGDDEWLDESRLQKQIEALDADKKLSAVFTDVEEYQILPDGEVKVSLHSDRPDRKRWMRKERIRGYDIMVGALNHERSLPFTLSAALYRKNSLKVLMEKDATSIRMPEMGVEDVPVIAALGRSGDVGFLPIVGYRYYVDGESVSNNLSYEKEYRFYQRVLRGVGHIARSLQLDPALISDHVSLKLSHIAAQARHAGRKEWIHEIRQTAKELGVKLPLRARIHLLLLRLQSGKSGNPKKSGIPR